MIKTVVREHHWTPAIIESLYLDDTDFLGLEYWYNDVRETNENLKSKIPKN